jgi:Sulfotransferase family
VTGRVVYVAGSARSGSTIFELALARACGIPAFGELRYIWERGYRDDQLCSCGAAFRDCDFWGRVRALLARGGDVGSTADILQAKSQLDRVRHIPRLAARRPSRNGPLEGDAYTRALLALYTALGQLSPTGVFVDSSKDPSYAFVLRALGIDLSVVHLVRDSRAVAYSWLRRRRRPEVADRVEFMHRRGPARSAAEWSVTDGLFALYRRIEPERTTCIRYEDFVAAPERTLAQVGERLGLECNPASSTASDYSLPGWARIHSISGNPVRFSQGAVRLRLDDEWRRALPPGARRVVTAVTLPGLLRHGYV